VAFNHHETAYALYLAAQSHCFVCHVLWNQTPNPQRTRLLDADQSFPWVTKLSLRLLPDPDPLRNDLNLTIHLEHTPEFHNGSISTTSATFYLRPVTTMSKSKQSRWPDFLSKRVSGSSSSSPSSRIPHLVRPTTDLEENLTLAKRWLGDCIQTHLKCNQYRDAKLPKPTRLLRVHKSRFCTMLSREIPKSATYATVSHCWGSAKFLKLTATTFDQLRAGLPIDHLPISFRHTMMICRRLNIKYLWLEYV
jgi:hypothetical protein